MAYSKHPLPVLDPRHAYVSGETSQNNGVFVPKTAFYIASGTISGVSGSTTGSVTMNFDTRGFRLLRCEVFHSGAAQSFDVSFESSSPNTGSFYDPRNTIVNYDGIPGSDDFSSGIDQIENIVAVTDSNCGLYMKFKPLGTGDNAFKYMVFLEGAIIYLESFR